MVLGDILREFGIGFKMDEHNESDTIRIKSAK